MKKQIALLLCTAMCFGATVMPVLAESTPTVTAVRSFVSEEDRAASLKQLGLFKGVSDTDFALDRAPSRTEALVMLIRVLGKEQEALSGSWSHPFTDIPEWADKYVGYAYTNGLTNGISPTLFGDSEATASTYLTFILRALGYSDTNGEDFTWDAPYELAKTTGVLSDDVNTETFLRADVATVSYLALSAKLKESDETLAEKLIVAGVFTNEQYSAVFGTTQSEEFAETTAKPEETTAPAPSESKTPVAVKPKPAETTAEKKPVAIAPSKTSSDDAPTQTREEAIESMKKHIENNSNVQALPNLPASAPSNCLIASEYGVVYLARYDAQKNMIRFSCATNAPDGYYSCDLLVTIDRIYANLSHGDISCLVSVDAEKFPDGTYKAVSYNGTSADQDYYFAKIKEFSKDILSACKTHFIPDSGTTLSDLGFIGYNE